MGWISRMRGFASEMRDMNALLAMPPEKRRIMVYSEDVASYNQLQGYLDVLRTRHGRPIIYVTSAADDPLLDDPPEGMSSFYMNSLVPSFLPRVDSDVLLTTMPDLGKLHIDRPRRKTCCVYTFHSLNSIHEVYREGSFDHYDAFFCTGPHHYRELQAHFGHYDLPVPELHGLAGSKTMKYGSLKPAVADM